MKAELDLEKPMPNIDLGEIASLVIWEDEDRTPAGAQVDGRIIAIDRDGKRPTAIAVKLLGNGAVVRVPIPAEVAALPAGTKHNKETGVEVRTVPHPSDGTPAVLLQLPDGFIIMRSKGAREVGQLLLKVAEEVAGDGL